MTDNITNPETNSSSSTPKPEVRQWRVGTISMGLSLVSLGAVLLMGRFNDSFTLANLLKFWPLILIILGLEMVLYNMLTVLKGTKIKFTYDVLSIFLVLLMLFVSSGLVALESTGVLSIAERALQVSERYIESEKVNYTVDSSLKSLVLAIDEGTANLRTYDGDDIKVSVIYKGYFLSQEEASQYAQDQLITTVRTGDALQIRLHPPGRGFQPHTYVRQEVTVLIPSHLDVELERIYGETSVSLEGLKSNWVINHKDSHRSLNVTLADMADAKVSVELNGSLKGNVQWDTESEEAAEKVWGEGTFTLQICQGGGPVEVNSR